MTTHTSWSSKSRTSAIAAISAATLILASCGGGEGSNPWALPGGSAEGTYPWAEPGGDDPERFFAPDPTDEAYAGFYTQEISWETCGQYDCGSIDVPLDWSDPSKGTVQIAFQRLNANGTPRGSLLINPGGPGGSGIGFLETAQTAGIFTSKLTDNYDIIGFDPRGVGESTAVTCVSGDRLEEMIYSYHDVETEEGRAASDAEAEEFAQACYDNTGEFLANVDTPSAARDMDVLRTVLGDDKLNYLGFSYGTSLGATYAHIYPGNVGRMVLDGATDLSQEDVESSKAQMAGFEQSLRTYAEDCANRSTCSLTGTPDEILEDIRDLLQETRTNPLRSIDGREVTATAVLYGIITPLYSEENWIVLDMALSAALTVGNGDLLLMMTDLYNGREAPGIFESNQREAFTAINCADSSGGSWTEDQRLQFAAELKEVSPTFGWFFGGASLGPCDLWKVPVNGGPFTPTAEGADPIVVVGTTGDPATPYQHAVSMASQLESGRLVTYVGEVHTAYSAANTCIATIVDDYLVDGVVPEDGVECAG